MHTNIFLIGPMGAGKSTVGKRLARALGLEFHDSDRELENRTGVDIPVIFEYEGEDGFRRREKAMIEELTAQEGVVVATGGGAVLDPENRKHLAGRGTVVYMQTSVDKQFERTRHDSNRPLLQTANPRERLAQIAAEREPLYREIADIIVSTDDGGVRALVDDILQRLP
ncbi:shikimate kinase AroK [Ectothiorhodospiraceae bacterium WFHF3C12]|nr:shikimate kinase AroK [Ectothiorhodospiraceae bacterium WFHF3C12]